MYNAINTHKLYNKYTQQCKVPYILKINKTLTSTVPHCRSIPLAHKVYTVTKQICNLTNGTGTVYQNIVPIQHMGANSVQDLTFSPIWQRCDRHSFVLSGRLTDPSIQTCRYYFFNKHAFNINIYKYNILTTSTMGFTFTICHIHINC